MKKYLMTSVAALAMCAAFTSCSHDSEGYSTLQEAKTAQYEAAFREAYGPIASNQNWGFSTSTRTRAINVNGNMWDPKDVPQVTDAEVAAIYDYVQYDTDRMRTMGRAFDTEAPKNIKDYYVTQVRNGKNTDNKYTFFDGKGDRTIENVGINMNHLQIAMNQNPSLSDLNSSDVNSNPNVSGWTHINNFNASDNKNFGGNTLVENGGTFDFAYHNSLDSKYHNKWILVDGANISSDGKYKDFYYVCFDFESTPECVTKFRFKYNGTEYGDVKVNGFYTVEDAIAEKLKVTINVPVYDENGKWLKNEDRAIDLSTDIDTEFGLRIDNIDNGDKHVIGNNVYTDWIVRITKGAPSETDRVKESGRIFCEDLGSVGDFDFNDVVFDAYIYESGKIEITVQAAGGTLPISVAEQAITMGKMKNTGEGSANPQQISISAETAAAKGWTSLVSIPIMVSQTSPANVVETYELTAGVGQVPQKICVPVGTKWADEYVRLEKAYPDFKTYVSNPATNWTSNVVGRFVDYDLKNNGETE